MRRPALGMLAAVGLLTSIAPVALAAGIPWKEENFEFSAFDEDVRVILGKVIKENGQQVTFRKGVEGTVSFNFKMLRQAAFNKLIEENGLQYDYNPETQMVVVYKEETRTGQMVTLNYITTDKLKAAANTLGLLGEIVADHDNNIVLFKGTTDQVNGLKSLAENLDKAEASRVKSRLSDDESSAKQREAMANATAKEAETAARAQAAEIRSRMMRDLSNIQVKIIPVKYATVGPSTQTFQGEQITVPGIDETLRSLLGLGGDKSTKDGASVAAGDAKTQALVADLKAEMGVVPPELSIDPRSNSIIVRGTPSAITQVEELVRRLDKPLPLVEIEVMIVNAAKGVTEELGVKWGMTGYANGDTRRGGLAASTGIGAAQLQAPLDSLRQVNLSSGTTTTTIGNVTTQSSQTLNETAITNLNPITLLPSALSSPVASFVYQGSRTVLQTQINALSEDNRAQTLASPRVVTINNQKARISNDRTRFVPTPPAPNQAGQLEKIPAGLKLTIVPSMIAREDSGEQNLIRMNVEASDKDVSFSSNGSAAVQGNEVLTQVVIPDGSTFVMGGLMNDYRREGKEGVPGLQDIPLLGALFQSKTSDNVLSETIFFITPRILKPEEVYASDLAQRRYLQSQRHKLSELRADLQTKSQLLDLNPSLIEDDE